MSNITTTTTKTPVNLQPPRPLQRIVDDSEEENDLHDYQIKCLHDTNWCHQLMGRLYDEHKVEQHFPHLQKPEVDEKELARIKEQCKSGSDNVEQCIEKGKAEKIKEETIDLMVASAQEEGRHSGQVNTVIEWDTLTVGGLLTLFLLAVIIVFFFSRSGAKDDYAEGAEPENGSAKGRSKGGASSKKSTKKSYKDKSSKKGRRRKKKSKG